MQIVRLTCVILFTTIGVSSSSGNSECYAGGFAGLGQVARDLSMGGTVLPELIPETAELEGSFCIIRRHDSNSGVDGAFSVWSIPHIRCSFPFRRSILGIRRYCMCDYHRRQRNEEGMFLSSGTLWSNSVFWSHPLSTSVQISCDVGLLSGRVVEEHLRSTHTYCRGRRLAGQILSGRILLTGRSHATYGGVRWYHLREHDAEIWVGVDHERTRVRRRMEMSLYPFRFSEERQNSLWLRFGAEERISRAVLFRYGFALTPKPSLFCLTSGCGICDKLMSVDTAIGWYCFETEHLLQLIMTFSLKL